jgi:GNAT superfamily N-acetyltransferase
MIVSSIASVARQIGSLAAGQLDTAYRSFTNIAGSVHDKHFLRIVTGEAHPIGNVAVVCDGEDTTVTTAAVGPLLGAPFPSLVLYPHGVSAAVAASLASDGYQDQGAMPAMAADIDALAPTALPAGYEWRRIGAGDNLRAWTMALAEGYGLPLTLARLFSPETLGADAAPDAPMQFYAVLRDGQPVSTSLLFLADGLAGIYSVSTLIEERGKGLGAHATAAALRAARALGYHVGVLQSSTAGHSVYLKLGFRDVSFIPMFLRLPG